LEADALKLGHAIGAPKLLFTAIPTAKLEEWCQTYGGEKLKIQRALEAEKVAVKKADFPICAPVQPLNHLTVMIEVTFPSVGYNFGAMM